MIIHYCEQWTDERFQVRKGMMSASKADAIGNCWAWLDTLLKTIIADRIANKTWITGAKNAYTDNWHELEPVARSLYELETGNEVTEVWFVTMDDYVWCSPDGVIFDWDMIVWLIEIKCLDNPWYLDVLMKQKAESKYERQMQMQMLVTGAEWCDFVAYNPNFDKSLYVKRYNLDLDKQEKLRKWFEIWKQKIQKIESDFNLLYKN